MNSSRFLGVVFVLLFTLTTKAETPLVVESAWIVANNEWLAAMPLTGEHLVKTRKFPDEIPANAAWQGATITDGNEIWTVIVLPLKPGNHDLGIAFRLKLWANTVIAGAFPDITLNMIKRGSFLYLISPGLSETDVDTLRLDDYWFDLKRRSHFAFIQYYPERTLLPTLPPEQENEGAFVKKVRQRSAGDYVDGQYAGKNESFFMGLRTINQAYTFVYEWTNVEGVEQVSQTETPFQFGGFAKPNSPFHAAFRFPLGKDVIEKATLGFRAGTTVTLPENRKENEKYNITFNFSLLPNPPHYDDWHVVSKEGVAVYYPKQPEDRPDEDGVPSNAEMDKTNEELSHSLLSFASNVRQSLLSMDWSQPIDLAFSNDDNVGYLACTYPPARMGIDWNLAAQLKQAAIEHVRRLTSPDDPRYNKLENLSWIGIGEFAKLETATDITWYRVQYGNNAVVFGYEPEKIYAAFRQLDSSGTASEEMYETMQQRLVQKINDSKQAVADGMKPPKTVFRFNRDGANVQVDYEATERGSRYIATIAQDSFGNVLALAQAFGGDYLNRALPFMQAQ